MHVRFSNVAKNYHMMSYEYLKREHPTLKEGPFLLNEMKVESQADCSTGT